MKYYLIIVLMLIIQNRENNSLLTQPIARENSEIFQKRRNGFQKSSYFDDTLRSMSQSGVFPGKLYITVDSDVAGVFVDFLKLTKDDSTGAFRRNLTVVQVNKEALSEIYSASPNTNVNEFVVILADFYNKLRLNQ